MPPARVERLGAARAAGVTILASYGPRLAKLVGCVMAKGLAILAARQVAPCFAVTSRARLASGQRLSPGRW